MKKVKNVVIITVVAILSVLAYMGLCELRLQYDNAIFDLLVNPGFWAFIGTMSCFVSMRRKNVKEA